MNISTLRAFPKDILEDLGFLLSKHPECENPLRQFILKMRKEKEKPGTILQFPIHKIKK